MHCGNITRHCGKTNSTTGRPQVHCGYTTDAHRKTIYVLWEITFALWQDYWCIMGDVNGSISTQFPMQLSTKWPYLNI